MNEAFFKDIHASGIVFEKLFNDGGAIPCGAIGLVATLIEFCIGEWSSGKLERQQFAEKVFGGAYETMMKDINTWEKINPTVTLNIRKKLYNRAVARIGNGQAVKVISHFDDNTSATSRVRMELQLRTGETDSENENSDNTQEQELEDEGEGEGEGEGEDGEDGGDEFEADGGGGGGEDLEDGEGNEGAGEQ